MTNPAESQERRRFIKFAVIGAVAAPLAGALLSKTARADDLPHLDESDATAKALGYVHDNTKVDAAKYPQHKPGQDCIGCKFYTGGEGWGPCQLFPGKAVAAKGWCSAFVAKA